VVSRQKFCKLFLPHKKDPQSAPRFIKFYLTKFKDNGESRLKR